MNVVSGEGEEENSCVRRTEVFAFVAVLLFHAPLPIFVLDYFIVGDINLVFVLLSIYTTAEHFVFQTCPFPTMLELFIVFECTYMLSTYNSVIHLSYHMFSPYLYICMSLNAYESYHTKLYLCFVFALYVVVSYCIVKSMYVFMLYQLFR